MDYGSICVDTVESGQPVSCDARVINGRCGHYQCEYPDETAHGQRCVNIILYGSGSGDIDVAVCDLGEDCLKKCLFSWTSTGRNTVKRRRFFVGRSQALWLMAAK